MTLRLRIMLVFGLQVMFGGWFFGRFAEVQRALGFSEKTFGLVLTGVPVGVFRGTLVVSRLVEGIGTQIALTLPLPLAFLA